jgi:hypothetical protein
VYYCDRAKFWQQRCGIVILPDRADPRARALVMAKAPAKAKLTPAEKYRQLKKHTEDAGMTVTERDGKIVVSRKRKGS